MKTLLALFLVILFMQNNTQAGDKLKGKAETKASVPVPDETIALKFINAYVAFRSAHDTSKNAMEWIAQNPMLTDNFKKAYKTIVDEAQKNGQVVGANADPIFDAQDYPEEGFTQINFDINTGLVTVAGKNRNDFTLVLKIALFDNQWRVDGAGAVNIPAEKRAKR